MVLLFVNMKLIAMYTDLAVIKNWGAVQDRLYDTVENAIKQLPDQYKKILPAL